MKTYNVILSLANQPQLFTVSCLCTKSGLHYTTAIAKTRDEGKEGHKKNHFATASH